MNLYWSNLLAWCLQIAIVVAVGMALPWMFRLREPRARLWYWHVVLLICLALPLLQPWARPATIASDVMATTGQFRLATNPTPAHLAITWPMLALVVLSTGIGLRLLWLGLGLYRLRQYRAAAIPLEHGEESFAGMRRSLAPDAEILISGNVSSPVTFGLRNPVILLPDRFLLPDRSGGLTHEERVSIVCHELIHIRRRDWSIAIAEELVRSVLWFHPAIWWLLGQIQLTREQVVDREVIGYTGDRDRYLDALLAIASLQLRADLAPAPLFLKKRHLRQRVESIVSGVTMTKRNLLLPLAAAFATLPLVIGIAAWQFPLRAAPQEVIDDAGVEIQLGAAKLLHRDGISYPEDARAKHISGTVVANLTLNEKGEVTDAAAISGPQELRRPVIQSVLNWHFSQDAGSTPDVQVAVHFDAARGVDRVPKVLLERGVATRSVTIEAVDLEMLPPALREKVEQSGVVQVGKTLAAWPAALLELNESLRSVDDHLAIAIRGMHDGKITVAVVLAGQQPRPLSTSANAPKTIRVGGTVQSANLLHKVTPKYPYDAKVARIQGTVKLAVTIGQDGVVKNLEVVSGPPELVGSTLEAVKDWVYKPTLLNGNPVEVITTIDVNYTLAQ